MAGRIASIIVLSVAGAITPGLAIAGDLAMGPFLRALAEAESIEERLDACSRLAVDAPPYTFLFCRGFSALVAGSDSLATIDMEDCLLQQPDFAIGCVAYGDAYAERSAWKRAIRWYEQANSIAPQRLDPLYGSGRCWLALGATLGPPAYEKALAAFEKMAELAPESVDGWQNVGMALTMLGRYDEAVESYRRALSLAPNDPQIHESLGSLASRRGDDEAAERHWAKAIALQPANASATRELASLYGRTGRLAEAVRTLEGGVRGAHVGTDAGLLRRDLGLLNLLQDQSARASELLDEARTLSPDARTIGCLAHARFLEGAAREGVALQMRDERLSRRPIQRQLLCIHIPIRLDILP